MMERALSWLNTHSYDVKIRKWDTDRWGRYRLISVANDRKRAVEAQRGCPDK